jgi:APA family basic amino acid/polyamine antiporter
VSASHAAPAAKTYGLSGFDAFSLVAGAVIGSAIFLAPADIFRALPSPAGVLALFVFGGLLSLCGALAYGEMGAMLPAVGGEYVYLRTAWGPFWGFLCGWTHFLVTQSGGIAALATGFGALMGAVFPLAPAGKTAASLGILAVLTAVNYRGLRAGAWTGNFFALAKIGGLAAMILAVAWRPPVTAIDWSLPPAGSLLPYASALVPILWAFEGWNISTFVAGEMRDPRRSLPRALLFGLLSVCLVYTVSIWVYLRALSVGELAASGAVAADAAIRAVGPAGGRLVTLTMIAALVGSLNACLLGVPRLYLAQARDGLFFSPFAHLHPRFGTPSRGLLLQAGWASLLVLSGTYETLLAYCTFGAWLFYCLAVSGVIVLRRRRPDLPRPFRMPGYPWSALAFLAVAAGFVISTFLTRPLTSLAGAGLVLSGAPLYWFWRVRQARPR